VRRERLTVAEDGSEQAGQPVYLGQACCLSGKIRTSGRRDSVGKALSQMQTTMHLIFFTTHLWFRYTCPLSLDLHSIPQPGTPTPHSQNVGVVGSLIAHLLELLWSVVIDVHPFLLRVVTTENQHKNTGYHNARGADGLRGHKHGLITREWYN
jgi:hypothetical protein